MGVPEFNPNSFFFTAFRQDLSFPYYAPEESSSFLVSHELVIVVYICAVLWIVSFIAALGTRGTSKLKVALQSFVALSIGTSILLSIVGGSWQASAEVKTAFNMADYQHGETAVQPSINLVIGLNSANMTMHIRDVQTGEEVATFNHDIHWFTTTEAESDYRKALAEGLPTPILSMYEYLSVDEGGLRYMRAFRSSGFVVYVLMWAAFAFWIVAIILTNLDVWRGSTVFLLCGLVQVIAVIVYASLQPKIPFKIPMHTGMYLTLGYGWNFWLTMVMGILTLLLSFPIALFAYYQPEEANKLFNNAEEIAVPFDDAVVSELEEKPTPRVVRMFNSIKRKSIGLSIKRDPGARRVSKAAHEPTISEEALEESPTVPRKVSIERHDTIGSMESIDSDADMLRLRRLNNSLYQTGDSDDESAISGDVLENGTIDKRLLEGPDEVHIDIPGEGEAGDRGSTILPAITISPDDHEVIEMEPLESKSEEAPPEETPLEEKPDEEMPAEP